MVYRHPLFIDDTEIEDDSSIWRRVNLTLRPNAVEDRRNGEVRVRPSSTAFIFSTKTISFSVLLRDIVEETGRGPEDVIYENCALVSLFVSDVRDEELGVAKTDGYDVAHADVFDKLDRSRSQRKLVQESLAQKAQWEIGQPDMQQNND